MLSLSHCMPISQSFGLTSEFPTAGCCEGHTKTLELLKGFRLLVKINYLLRHVRCCNNLLHVVVSLFRFAVAYVIQSLMPTRCHQQRITKKHFSNVYKVLVGWTPQLPKYELPLPRQTKVKRALKRDRGFSSF